MRTFGRVRGVVVGSWAEASPDVDWLLHQVAEMSTLHVQRPGARDAEDRLPVLVHALRRRWGMTFARANAQLLLDRLAFVGWGAQAAQDRRMGARGADAARRRRLQRWTAARPRLMRGNFTG